MNNSLNVLQCYSEAIITQSKFYCEGSFMSNGKSTDVCLIGMVMTKDQLKSYFTYRLPAKRTIIRQGHNAENFYFIISGTGMFTT